MLKKVVSTLIPQHQHLLKTNSRACTAFMTQTHSTHRLPLAKRIEFKQVIHGEEISDPYHWMRNKDADTDVMTYIQQENDFTDKHLNQKTEQLQKTLYDEFLSRIKETDESVPYKSDNYMYYHRTEKGKQYAIYCRRSILESGALSEEHVILDLNEIAEKEEYDYLSLGALNVSPNHQYMAYSLDVSGDEVYTLYFKDLSTGEDIHDEIEEVTDDILWANDNKTIFYVTMDSAMRPYKVFRHEIDFEKDPMEEDDENEEEGEDEEEQDESSEIVRDDECIYTETDQRFNVGIGRSASDQYLFISSGSHTTTEIRYLEADNPNSDFKLLFERQQEVEYDAEHHEDYFYIVENSKGAKNSRVIRVPVSQPSWDQAEEILPHDPNVMIEGLIAFKSFLAVFIREHGLSKVMILDPVSFSKDYIVFPDASYSLSDGDNDEYDTDFIRLGYSSFVSPPTVFDYYVKTKELKQVRQLDIFNYDPTLYHSEQLQATSSVDGVEIPISLVYKKGQVLNGTTPCLLNAYGAYASTNDPYFDSTAVSLLDRGYVIAIAHIRGGGEKGKLWHESGRMLNKKNTFSDFIDCAEHLIQHKYTSADRLAIRGGSAGGLLIGNVVNSRPDLFAAAVNEVGFVDVTNSMLDSSLPLTVSEYEEWGNPSESKEYFNYLSSYSPYDNIIREENIDRKYPAILLTSGLNDPRVPYFESIKYAAKLRWFFDQMHQKNHGDHTLYLKMNLSEGHAGKSGRYEALKDEAFVMAFLLTHLPQPE